MYQDRVEEEVSAEIPLVSHNHFNHKTPRCRSYINLSVYFEFSLAPYVFILYSGWPSCDYTQSKCVLLYNYVNTKYLQALCVWLDAPPLLTHLKNKSFLKLFLQRIDENLVKYIYM